MTNIIRVPVLMILLSFQALFAGPLVWVGKTPKR
jgi:hypothetical protein